MKNKISDVRDHLIATLEALRDEEKPMEIDRAKAIANVANVLIDSARVEIEAMRVLGATGPGTGFLALPAQGETKPEALPVRHPVRN